MKQCYFCTNNAKLIDYKELETLKKFLDPHARVLSRRRSEVCAKHQRQLTLAIKNARFMAFLPFLSR